MSWAPSGVTAVITPWNAPLMLATWRIAPALAAGNTVVAKPPEWAPLTASLLADITARGRAARRRVQRRAGPGRARPGRRWPRTRTWPGSASPARSPPAAWSPRRPAAQLTPVSLELGGKSPLLVFADADLDLAVRHAVGQYDNAGQVCLAGTRLLVEEAIAEEFTARFAARAAALRQGDPRDEATDVGPEHHPRAPGPGRRLRPPRGRRRAAPAARRGGQPRPRRALLPADAAGRRGAGLGDPHRGGVRPGAHAADLRRRGRGGRAGQRHPLRAGGHDVHRRPGPGRAGVAPRLVAGTVWVNCFFVRDLRAPFGGAGQSGIGREGGTWSFDFYGDVKNTVYAPEGWRSRWVRLPERDCSLTSRRSCSRTPSASTSTRARRSAWSPGWNGCAPRSSRALDYDTVVVLDSHWHTTVEFVVSAHDIRAGLFTSDELPRGMCRIPYDWRGDPELAHAMAAHADEHGTWITAIDDPCLPVHYATVNLWTYLGRGLGKRWVSVSTAQTGDTEDFLRAGRALGAAIAQRPPRCC